MHEEDRNEIIYKYLPNYFQFLIKIGKFEKARELCLECFTLSSKEETLSLCRNSLI
jgi:hypothetical protein